MNLFLESSRYIPQALLSQFANKLERDTREPIFTFQIPTTILGLLGQNNNIQNDAKSFTAIYYGLLAPRFSFWWQLTLLIAMQSMICIGIACFIYKFIIEKRGTATAFLSGYGVVLPFVLLMPFHLCRYLQLQNMCLIMSVASTPTLVFFRCLEAIYGTSPAAVEKDLTTYCLYYCAVIQFQFDPKSNKPIKAKKGEIQAKGLQFVRNFFLMGAFYSLIAFFTYLPFPTSVLTHQTEESLIDLFHWGHLCNNLALAFLTYFGLDTGTLGAGCAISLLSGNSTLTVNDEPLTKSTSITDFWGRRWNQLVHGVLKRGIFKPTRKYFSKSFAAIITFVFSGLLHEYVILVTALKNENLSTEETNTLYDPRYGKHMAFFAWNGFVMTMEYFLAGNLILLWLGKRLPQPIKTFLVLMTVIPISHWFTHEYVNSGFFDDYSIAFPKIICLDGNVHRSQM